MLTRTDPAQLRAAAEAQLDRLRGPLWSSREGDEAGDWLPGADESSASSRPPVAPVAIRAANPAPAKAATPRRKAPGTTRPPRRPGRPSFETSRLPAREVRIPVVVDDRTREVAAWVGIEPTEALWMLATRGWESWRRDHGASPEIPA